MKKTYAELVAEYPDVYIPYALLLLVREWDDRRWQILMRDDYTCSGCKEKAKDRWFHGLQVHHCYYALGKLPWEYPDEALVTVCAKCHKTFHENSRAPRYTMQEGNLVVFIQQKCVRCDGEGWIEHYRHWLNGICFSCWGSGGDVRIHPIDNPPSKETFGKMLAACYDPDDSSNNVPF